MCWRLCFLSVCLGLLSSVLGQLTRDCSTTGFTQIGTNDGVSPFYPADPSCYSQINKDFKIYRVPKSIPWNKFAVVDSCIEFEDTQTTNGGWFLQQILRHELGKNNLFALKQYFGNIVYQANNALLYNGMPPESKSLRGSKSIIPLCKQKNNKFADLTFWYNSNTGVLKVNLKVAVPFHYAYGVADTLHLPKTIRDGLMRVFNYLWLPGALRQAASYSLSSCFADAMNQLGKSGASVTCGGAYATTKADEAKEVQAEADAERKLQAKGIKIQAKGAVKVKGGGVSGKATTTLGGR